MNLFWIQNLMTGHFLLHIRNIDHASLQDKITLKFIQHIQQRPVRIVSYLTTQGKHQRGFKPVLKAYSSASNWKIAFLESSYCTNALQRSAKK